MPVPTLRRRLLPGLVGVALAAGVVASVPVPAGPFGLLVPVGATRWAAPAGSTGEATGEAAGGSAGNAGGGADPASAPRIEAVTVTGDRALTVAWLAAATTDAVPPGPPVVEASDGGPFRPVADGTCPIATDPTGADPTGADPGRCQVAGLTAGVAYRFRVVAASGAVSPVSDPVVAITAPGRVTAVAAVTGADAGAGATTGARPSGSVSLTWSGPAATAAAPVASYAVEVSAGDAPFTAVPDGACDSPTTPACHVDGLVAGTAYRFRVSAVNAAGVGPAAVTTAAVVPA
jgi:hypothetical protein